ncbi:MAG: PilZ domain-containing protein [Terriglobales bacterium]
MNETKTSAPGADWTKLLTDPDVVSHLGELLQAYRDAEPARRDQALRDTMRKIKNEAAKAQPAAPSAKLSLEQPVATAPAATPPFEPDIFTPCWGQDRRRYPRMKCFVAVELRVDGSPTPVWGNLANTSLGGCFVETVSPLKTGVQLEIGLWVANGKIWVKGLILNGIVTQSNPSFGVRLKFDNLEAAERETLRQFLKFVESTTKAYQSQQGYLAQMKR